MTTVRSPELCLLYTVAGQTWGFTVTRLMFFHSRNARRVSMHVSIRSAGSVRYDECQPTPAPQGQKIPDPHFTVVDLLL